jgi:hypothetical protein
LRIVERVAQEELAVRAGVHPEWVTRLVGLGILKPAVDGSFSVGDVRRARLIDGLERAGLPLEAMAEVLVGGELSLASFDLPLYQRFSLLTETTFQQASAEHGVPLELLMVVREAVGYAQPGAEDLVREDELRVVPLIKLQLSKGFLPAVIGPVELKGMSQPLRLHAAARARF